jgi:hypothetical protein
MKNYLSNVKGMARREDAEIDQTDGSASTSPTCSAISLGLDIPAAFYGNGQKIGESKVSSVVDCLIHPQVFSALSQSGHLRPKDGAKYPYCDLQELLVLHREAPLHPDAPETGVVTDRSTPSAATTSPV